MTFLNKQGLVKVLYLTGITLALMGLVLLLIFGILIGKPYLHEKALQEYVCTTFNVTEKGRQVACNTTEKSRDSRFPCYSVIAELALQNELLNGSSSVKQANDHVHYVSLYDNYVTYAKFSDNELRCSTFPCHVPPLQNQREAETFAKNFATGKSYRCFFSGHFDGSAALLNRTVDELPVMQLMAWPAGAFLLGVLLISVLYLAVGCGIWEDTVMV